MWLPFGIRKTGCASGRSHEKSQKKWNKEVIKAILLTCLGAVVQEKDRYLHGLKTGTTGRDMRKRNWVTRSPLLQPEDKRFVMAEPQVQELLPGIPNEITLCKIATKLPWRAFHLLSSVSRSWRQAIRSRQVHDARVHYHLTEQLVVCNHNFSKNAGNFDVSQISLYSMRDCRFYDVPPIPHLGGIPKSCQCVSLDGKLYVLGGVKDQTSNLGSKEVYVLDLAGQTRGQRRWRQCANMRVPRQEFGCGVMGGRIYVFGGTSVMEPVCASEVYDPTVNAWSPLPSMLSSRFRHNVAIVGEELFVHGGCRFEPKYLEWRERRLIVNQNGFVVDVDGKVVCTIEDALDNYGGDDQIYIHQNGGIVNHHGEPMGDIGMYYTNALSLEIYHPGKDEWRMVEPFQTGSNRGSNAKIFVAGGKYYSMNQHGIHVYNVTKTSWTHLHWCSFATIGPVGVTTVDPVAVTAMSDELLAVVRWRRRDILTVGSTLVRSRGFGSNLIEIVWENATRIELYFGTTQNHDAPFIVPINL